MRLQLIWVGKAARREPEADLCARYAKRIAATTRFDEKVLKPIQTASLSDAEIRQRESERITAELQPGDYLVLCDERGKQLSSPGFADFLTQRQNQAVRRVVFCIGGAMGVTDSLRQRADFVLSFSQMTLPHALARVMLLEQVYRALCIQSGHPYHHEG